MYFPKSKIVYILEKDKEKYYHNAIKRITGLKYKDKRMENELSRFLPEIYQTFRTKNGKYAIVLDKTEDVYPLKNVFEYFGKQIDGKHVAWMISRLCSLTCYLEYSGLVHNGIHQNNLSYMPHLTPSNTGIKNPLEIIGGRETALEVCYVSRTYMTRHGAGRFDTECKKSDINEAMIDLTNVPNRYQDTIRYGMLVWEDLKNRMDSDSGSVNGTKSLAVTHLNEYGVNRNELETLFDEFRIYGSDGMTHHDVFELV